MVLHFVCLKSEFESTSYNEYSNRFAVMDDITDANKVSVNGPLKLYF